MILGVVRTGRAISTLATAGLALGVLLEARPAAVHTAAGDPTSAVVATCCWGAWLLAGYLLVAVGIATLRHLPACPRWLVRVASSLTPGAVRRAVDLAVGATTAAAVLAGPAVAHADPGPGLDWPGVTQATSRVAGTHLTPVGAAPSRELVVGDGDSLWSIAARELGPGASAAEVAAAWPRLYAANQAVIGPDPGLIHPGLRLRPPTPERRTNP